MTTKRKLFLKRKRLPKRNPAQMAFLAAPLPSPTPHLISRRSAPRCCSARRKAAEATAAHWHITLDPNHRFTPHLLHDDPVMIRVEQFLTSAQCDDLICTQARNHEEASHYLNYRVNAQVHADGTSEEAAALIASTAAPDGDIRTLSPCARAGFRAQIHPSAPALQPVLAATSDLLGFASRRFVFHHGPWIRPSVRTVVVRDQTTVRYHVGEGVAPHVDGKDVTVLICLQEPDLGGRTVFPEDALAIPPRKGCALVYRSKHELLHFAEQVHRGTKWVLQLLIDFQVRDDELDVDYTTGAVFR